MECVSLIQVSVPLIQVQEQCVINAKLEGEEVSMNVIAVSLLTLRQSLASMSLGK